MPRLFSTGNHSQKDASCFRGLLVSACSALIFCASTASAQSGPRLIDPALQFPQQVTPKADHGAVANSAPSATVAAPAAGPAVSFTLTDMAITGADTMDQSKLAAIWRPLRGKKINTQDIVAVSNQIAQLYAREGYELVSVQVPAQQFAGGKVRVQVIEGHIDGVRIEGNTSDTDLTLLKSYAAAIIADQPLHRLTLERYILLMNDIPGLKVGSRFEAIPGAPGAVRLILTVLLSRYDWGVQVNNFGVGALGNTQATVVGAVNGLFKEGDQTQLTFGAPAEVRRYQYVGVSHRTPIGSDGATAQIGAGYLQTDPAGAGLQGDANIVNAMFNYPLIRSVNESLILSGGADMLNSNSALLGMALANERTRSLRASALFTLSDTWRGTTTASLSLSQGINALGARRGNVAYGGPTYTKLGLLLSREQLVPLDIILRGKLQGQYAPNRLPNSEQFLFGGGYLGRAFDTAFLSGDRGIGAGLEAAHATPSSMTPDFLAGSEAFGFVDWGEALNIRTRYALPYTHAASVGAGLRLKLLERATLELAGGFVINQPRQYVQVESPRFIFGFTRLF